jgi:hypothetical protein
MSTGRIANEGAPMRGEQRTENATLDRARKGLTKDGSGKQVNLGRHEHNCTVCAHPEREEIERDFIDWKSPSQIAIDHGLTDRKSIYRHAHAFGLFPRRDRNIRAALVRIVERASEVEPTAQAVVAAVQAYAKINSRGHWIERSEQLNLN